ncbi:MAG: hypothetical protein IPP08_05290 [Chlorobiota bacterium]|nr:MAG: hypothetical protein IPP08_05290 [Chlorobiota bacterium]
MNKIITTILFSFIIISLSFAQEPKNIDNDFGQITHQSLILKLKEDSTKIEFIKNYISDFNQKKNFIVEDSCPKYIIPVVFHVYGIEDPKGTVMQNGSPVNIEVLKSALLETNKDFNGLNTDFYSVHDSFKLKRGVLKIEFRLAQIDPFGKPTNGMVIHEKEASYAKNNTSNTIPEVVEDAWDNFKYVNIYIQKDWSGQGITNLSGIAWPPDLSMSQAKMARICYNGRYLGKNCNLPSNGSNMDFTGVFTHEFGHFLDLGHLFKDNLCYNTEDIDIDGVQDTPNGFNGEGCHSPTNPGFPNCPFPPAKGMPQGSLPTNSLCNSENYMTYNGCYKMFTYGQIGKMIKALNHPSRITLWEDSNVKATGVNCDNTNSIIENKSNQNVFSLKQNPIVNNQLTIYGKCSNDNYKISITNDFGVQVYINEVEVISRELNETISLKSIDKGLFFITIKSSNFERTLKLISL